ncbi:ParB/RepB/Spo0J family partition protein [Sphingomonas sp. AAP5]|uniref:ParB/RepB/Spo0J family partition protein n=1 Tax=Sphingomonas sp. AAP5 TaxID=1523415 RepID=UPI001F0E3029|nr:ParB/RepB/Spo0J family partition protein [Sphingomonas sp. AAP5]
MDFGDIFATKDEVAKQGRVLALDVDQVYPDPENVRTAIDQAEIEGLAATIKERGQIQPITVAPADADGRYQIYFGERRWRACRHLGIKVDAIVSDQTDAAQVRIDQFIENDQREQLSTRDTVAFVQRQLAAGMTIADLARATGRDQARLSRFRALIDAPDFIAARLDDIPVRGAAALVKAAGRDQAATRAFVEGAPIGTIGVAECERFARELSGPSRPPAPDVALTPAPEPSPKTAKVEGEGAAPIATALTGRSRSKPVADEPGRFIDVDGKRARIIEAVLQFDDEAMPRTVRFSE